MNQIEPTAWHHRFPTRFGALAVFVAALFVVAWRFGPFMPEVFFGDDLDYMLLLMDGGCATDASQILTTACYERFRPVASGFVLAMMELFRYELSHYIAVNVLLHSLIVALVFAIGLRLSRGNWVVALLVALAVATTRFAAYQVTQMIGPVESLTLALCLGAVYGAIRADESVQGAWKWSWMALAMAFLAMHSHERSMVVAVWLAMAFLLSPSVRQLGGARLLALLAACVALPVFYIAFKTFVLKAHFLIGTGGTHIDPDPSLIFEHARLGVRSIFGFNTGPDYLVGLSITPDWPAAWRLAVVLAAAWLAMAAFGTIATLRTQAAGNLIDRLRWPILLVGLAIAMLLPALLTIRLEQRWLLAPFTMMVLCIAWAAGAARGRAAIPATTLAALLVGANFLLDGMVMRYFDRLFFVSSPRFAEQVKKALVDTAPEAGGPIVFLTAADQCNWTLDKGGFFRIYGRGARRVECMTSLEAAANAKLPKDTRIYSVGADGKLVDVTGQGAALAQLQSATTYSFLQSFESGQISDKTHVATPTGQGALKMPWDSTSGVRETLTIISGFAYSYEGVPIDKDSMLSFGVGMIYPSPSSARAVVTVQPAGGGEPFKFTRDLVPPKEGQKVSFEAVTVPLSRFAGTQVSIRFAVETPDGNTSGHWIGFADPRIIAHAAR